MQNQNIISFTQGQLKNIAELPPHITYEEFNAMLQAVDQYFNQKKQTPKRSYHRNRDKLLLSLMWETGGRIDDICSLKTSDFDFRKRELNLYMKKRRKNNIVTLSDRMLFEISEYLRNWQIKDRLFDLTRQRAWQLIKKYSRIAGIDDVHPHKFRHGLAIYLLQQGVPIPVISARLGHSSVYITMQLYMKVTPEVQRHFMNNVPMRED